MKKLIKEAKDGKILTFKEIVFALGDKSVFHEPILDMDNRDCYLARIYIDDETGFPYFEFCQDKELVDEYIDEQMKEIAYNEHSL